MGGTSPQNRKFDVTLLWGRNEKFETLLRTKVSANLPFVELRAPHRGIFPFTRKDTKGVSKGLPLRYPLGEVTVKVGGANQNDAPSPWKSNFIRFSGDGKQNQFTFLTKTIPSRSAVTRPLYLSRNFLREKEGVHNCTKTESDFKRECQSLSFFFSYEIRYWESFTDVLIYIGKWFCRLPIKTLRQQIKASRKYQSFAV